MRLSRILPAAAIALALLLMREATASAHFVFCMSDPPVQVVTPGGANLTVNNTLYLPPYQMRLVPYFDTTASAIADGHGGTLVIVHVQVASGVSSVQVVSTVQHFQVSSTARGTGGTVVSLDLDVPAA